jgi:uncharacterized protein
MVLTLNSHIDLYYMRNTFAINDKIIIVFGRILFFLIIYIVSVTVLDLFVYLIFKINPFVDNNPSLHQSLLSAFTNFIAVIFVIFIYKNKVALKNISGNRFDIRKFRRNTFLGFYAGGGIIITGFVVNYLIGSIEIKLSSHILSSFILNSIVFFLIAFSEELIFRGFMLNQLIEIMSKYWALVISAFIFSLFHTFNPNFSIISFVNIFLAGILLGLLFIHLKSLYAPIIQHFSWNYFQGPICGYKISGIKINDTLFASTINSNNLINGGNFGFEGSLVCLALLIISIALVLKLKLNI